MIFQSVSLAEHQKGRFNIMAEATTSSEFVRSKTATGYNPRCGTWEWLGEMQQKSIPGLNWNLSIGGSSSTETGILQGAEGLSKRWMEWCNRETYLDNIISLFNPQDWAATESHATEPRRRQDRKAGKAGLKATFICPPLLLKVCPSVFCHSTFCEGLLPFTILTAAKYCLLHS